MKIVRSMVFFLIFSITVLKCNCREKDQPTMIYAVGSQVFVKDFGRRTSTGFLKEFDGAVSGLAVHDDYLYVSVRRTDSTHSSIWRAMVLPTNFSSFEVEETSWKILFSEKTVEEDLLNMAVVNGSVYSGRSDGKLWNCSLETPYRCQDYYQFIPLKDDVKYSIRISELEYDPKNGILYAVVSYKFRRDINPSGSWYHKLWQCPMGDLPSCHRFMYLDGWATLEVAFNALWIADAEKILKCPYDRIMDSKDRCITYTQFEKPIYVNIVAFGMYLYIRHETDNEIWRCDPNVINSCSPAFKVRNHLTHVGPFMLI